MSHRGKLSRDQKRKKKLAERARKTETWSVEPYTGKKYRADQYLPLVHATEVGIYECYVMTNRRLTDRQVGHALEYLVLQLRGHKPELPADNPQVDVDGQPEDMAAWRIRSHWEEMQSGDLRFSIEDRIGVLRALLNSVDNWSHGAPDARGYLHFIEGFLQRTGVSVEAIAADGDEAATAAPSSSAEEAALTRLGEIWLATDAPLAKKEFDLAARSRLNQGKASVVIEVCERLMGLSPSTGTNEQLQELLQEAWRQQRRLGMKP